MPLTTPTGCRDHEQDWSVTFHRRRGAEINALATAEVIEEFRRDTDGASRRSLDLRQVLNYVRMTPIEGRHFAYAAASFHRYHVGVLSQVRGAAPVIDESVSYASESEAVFAVFVMRLRQLGAPAAFEVEL
jgi:hypothetical protein